MSNIVIQIDGIDRVLSKLGEDGLRRAMRRGVQAAALEVKGRAAEYPPAPARGRRQPGLTAKQRRYLHWAVRSGIINIPYRRSKSGRSERLATRWAVREIDQGLGAVISNNASYAPLLHGTQTQTRFHAETGWKTTKQIAQSSRQRVVNIIENELSRALR